MLTGKTQAEAEATLYHITDLTHHSHYTSTQTHTCLAGTADHGELQLCSDAVDELATLIRKVKWRMSPEVQCQATQEGLSRYRIAIWDVLSTLYLPPPPPKNEGGSCHGGGPIAYKPTPEDELPQNNNTTPYQDTATAIVGGIQWK